MRRLLLAFVLTFIAGAPAALHAQEHAAAPGPAISAMAPAAVTRASAPCSYAECALRVEPGLFSGPHLVRGTSGNRVVDLGRQGPSDIVSVFAGNDSATAYAR